MSIPWYENIRKNTNNGMIKNKINKSKHKPRRLDPENTGTMETVQMTWEDIVDQGHPLCVHACFRELCWNISHPRQGGSEICLEYFQKVWGGTPRMRAISWWTGTTFPQTLPGRRMWRPIKWTGRSWGQWCWVDSRRAVVPDGCRT